MALCLIMMFGRLGSVAGANIVGALLFTACDVIFYVAAFVLIGMVMTMFIDLVFVIILITISVATGISYVVMKRTDDAMPR